MLRWLFHLLTALALLLCIAISALWIHSHYWADSLIWGGSTTRELASTPGLLLWNYSGDERYSEPFHWYAGPVTWKPDPFPPGSWLGVNWWKGTFTPKSHLGMAPVATRGFTLPYWLLALLTAVLPAFWLLRFIRRRRKIPAGLCRNCRYDLRAHPPGGRCPECGTPIGPPQSPLPNGPSTTSAR